MASDFVASGEQAGMFPRPQLGATSPRYGEKAIKAFLFGCAALSVAVTTAIVISLLLPTLSFFEQVSALEFLTGTEWAPAFANASFGVLPIVIGTLTVVFWGLIVAIPVGLASAIYLAEDVLPFLEWRGPFSVGVAGIAVGLMIVPLISSISDDAMRSVPEGLREGAYALGATKLEVSTRVVFPAAISGIVAAIVLAASRAIGETMVVLLAAGASPNLTVDPTASILTMTAFIGQTATGDIATGTIQYDTIFAVGALLFVITLAMNMLAIRLVRRFREIYE